MRQAGRFLGFFCVLFSSSVAHATIGPEQAARHALNDLRVGKSVVSLAHPQYEATWTRDGVHFTPRRGPSWQWSLETIRLGAKPVKIARQVVPSADRGLLRVDYDRGALVERYLLKENTVEQQFVIPRRLSSDGRDLVIEAKVRSNGAFATRKNGWAWSDNRGAVTLGDVTVLDRNGARLPARMHVTATGVRLVVDGQSLSKAVYPVTVDPEIGSNDFRISSMGVDGDGSEVSRAAVAFNGTTEYLVVWGGYDGELEIWGQRINATTGAEVGSDFRISDMGGIAPGFTYTVNNPDVVYNATSNQYLVVWRGDDDVAPLIDGDFEIFGQLINAATGAEIAPNDFRISFMGDNGETTSSVDDPAVAWDSVNNRYLVVWAGDDENVSDDENEIWGRVLDSAGNTVSLDDVRLTNVGTDGDLTRYALEADVAFDSVNGRYLVTWQGDDADDNAFDIYGQLVTTDGARSGSAFRISDMGDSDVDDTYRGQNSRIAFNPTNIEYLVVWTGDDNATGDDHTEVFGQRINANTGAVIGSDFRITTVDPPLSVDQGAFTPDVAWSAASKRYLVVFHSDALVDNEPEIWGQVLSATGTADGNRFRLSDGGVEGSSSYLQLQAQLAFNGATALVVWRGSDDIGVNNEVEVYGQFYSTNSTTFTIDDFSVNQGPLTLSAAPGTVTDHDADSLAIQFGGERNLRVSGSDVSGGNITVQVSGGSLTFNRPAGSLGEVEMWWDGDQDSGNFEIGTATPIDLTAGGSIDKFLIAVNSSSSSTLQLRLLVWTDGGNLSSAFFTIPMGGGTVEVPFSSFTVTGGAGATFTEVRAVQLKTATNTGAWTASISSIRAGAAQASPATTTITANPTSIVANGSSTSTITVQAKDSGGTDITTGGSVVTLQTTLGTLGTVTDNDNGTYTATLTAGTTTGPATITGTLDAVAIVDNAVVTFSPGPAVSLVVNAPPAATGGVAFDVTVTARDANSNTATGYTGTVHFTSTDGAAALPANYTFTGGDAGVRTFSVTLNTAGTITLTATDTVSGSITGNDSITVTGNTTTVLGSSANPSLVGQNVTFTATVTSATTGTITGTVTFKDGLATIGTGPVSGGTATFSTTSLSQGTHSITAEYPGNANFNPSTSNTVNQVVNLSNFGPPAFVSATATSTSSVLVMWTAVSGATGGYQVWRSTAIGNGYSIIATTGATSYPDSAVSANTSYAYKVLSVGSSGSSGFSSVDAATTTVFTDPALSSSIQVKGAHIVELRTAVAAMRVLASLSASTFTDTPIINQSTIIKRVHITELRTALDAALSAIGLAPPAYTDGTITAGTTLMKAAHVSELRAGAQ